MNVMDVFIIVVEIVFVFKEFNILWLCLCIVYFFNYKIEIIRYYFKGIEKRFILVGRRVRLFLDWRGRKRFLEEVLFYFIYLFNVNLLSVRFVLVGFGDLEMIEIGF